MNAQTIDTVRLKESVDLRELAATYTTLRRESTKELAGPCPKCGGDDRFRVTAEWFFCRQCHPKRADAIELMTWIHGVSFKEAAAMLQGQALPAPAAPRRPEKRQQPTEWNAAEAERALLQYQRALWDSANVKAHEYLLDKRGLDAHTWAMFGLGYRHDTPLPGTWSASTRGYSHPPQPAIAIPWRHGKHLVAIRYRFLATHTYIDADGNERTEKQRAEPGSQFAGHLFGGQAMSYFPPPAAGRPDVLGQRTLVITEGELNAMSIWQGANETRLDVLSLGSESQKLTPAQVDHAKRYKAVVLWADREEIAGQLQAAVPNAYAVTSAKCLGQDANDLLQAGKLGLYLSTWRFDAAKDRAAQETLLFDLLEVVRAWHRVDDGTKQVAQWMAEQLGVQMEVTS